MRLFLIGFMGSGKSHWGALLSEKMELPFFDLDSVIEAHEGKTIARIFAENGEEYFRYLEKDQLEKLIDEHENFILSCGGGTPCYFNNIQTMNEKGLVVWLNTSTEALVQRLLRQKVTRPLIRDIADEELADYITRKLASRRIYYSQARVVVQEESLTLDTFIEMIRNA